MLLRATEKRKFVSSILLESKVVDFGVRANWSSVI